MEQMLTKADEVICKQNKKLLKKQEGRAGMQDIEPLHLFVCSFFRLFCFCICMCDCFLFVFFISLTQ
jgi:hypothetical protein